MVSQKALPPQAGLGAQKLMVGATRRVARSRAARRAAPTFRNDADGLFTKPSKFKRSSKLFRQKISEVSVFSVAEK
jgi:hypothetical protein